MNTLFRAIAYMMIGVTGEIIYTGIKALILKKDLRLQGYTQIWVMPLYALGGVFLFEKLADAISGWNILSRFSFYALIIFAIEFTAGFIAKKITGKCPWEYRGRWSVGGYIKLSRFWAWGGLGLLFEIIHNYLLTLLP